MTTPYELYAGFKLLDKSSLTKKIQNQSSMRYFCVLCNVLFSTFVVFAHFFRESLHLLVRSNNLNL